MTQKEFKQNFHRAQLAQARKHKLLLTMLIVVVAALALPLIATAIMASSGEQLMFLDSGATMVASMAIIGSIEDTSDKDAAGKQIAYQVWLVALDQIDKSVAFLKPTLIAKSVIFHYWQAKRCTILRLTTFQPMIARVKKVISRQQ